MGIWSRLLSTDYGQMSLAVIAFILAMGVFFFWYFNRKINRSAEENARLQAKRDQA